jgi:acetoin utilization deacetylase AcuC-like enzyme
MKLFYCDEFVLPLPAHHRFPMSKYRLLRERLSSSNAFSPHEFHVPPAASFAELTRAHAPDYVLRMERGEVSAQEMRVIGFPWSPEMVERSKRSSGATLQACRAALREGAAANLAGGTHHAFYDRGEGYCVFNDAAVSARTLIAENLAKKILIIDCDVHQGNGTAAILANDAATFTFSIHGANNFPFTKEASDLDIELDDGCTDDAYLASLHDGLAQSFAACAPDLAIYIAGADPFEDDKLGRLKLTKAGLLQRDEAVLRACHSRGVPVAIAMAGGYARDINDTVDIHANTIIAAKQLYG